MQTTRYIIMLSLAIDPLGANDIHNNCTVF
jgi:hypothetical protein